MRKRTVPLSDSMLQAITNIPYPSQESLSLRMTYELCVQEKFSRAEHEFLRLCGERLGPLRECGPSGGLRCRPRYSRLSSMSVQQCSEWYASVLWIRIRIRRIRKFLDLLDSDPSIIQQK
jgi:hypothetical protein